MLVSDLIAGVFAVGTPKGSPAHGSRERQVSHPMHHGAPFEVYKRPSTTRELCVVGPAVQGCDVVPVRY
jgi:hypothetical protein